MQMEPLELALVRSHIADLQRDAALSRQAASAPRPAQVPVLMTLDALGARLTTAVRSVAASVRPATRTASGTPSGMDVCCA
jgi:hypothetical protein